MKEYFLHSSFAGTQTFIFHYQSHSKKTRDAVFILKGLYGGHDPSGNSWDNGLISLLQEDHHVIIIRTGRLESEDEKTQFEGKTFQQECQDFKSAYEYCRGSLLSKEARAHGIAMSFGGTTLLGCPSVLKSMDTVLFIGSGCGRNLETTKPLLSTMPKTDVLLSSIYSFRGAFVFLHGGLDDVVPLESQRRIFSSAANVRVRAWIEYPALNHKLSDSSGSQLTTLINRHFRHFL